MTTDSNIDAACTMLAIDRLKNTCQQLQQENAELKKLRDTQSDTLWELNERLENLCEELTTAKVQRDEAVELLQGLQNEFEGARLVRENKLILMLGEFYDTHISEFLVKVKKEGSDGN